MSSKSVISLLIICLSCLALSLVITFAVVLPASKMAKQPNPEAIPVYSFNFPTGNSGEIRVIGEEFSLKKPVEFKPTKQTEWSDSFVHYLGNRAADGVEMSSTQMLSYVLAIPFSINNYALYDVSFNLNVIVEENGNESLTYKVYDYTDSTYKTLEDINNNSYAGGERINSIKSGLQSNFCLVACVSGNLNLNLTEPYKINVSVKIS